MACLAAAKRAVLVPRLASLDKRRRLRYILEPLFTRGIDNEITNPTEMNDDPLTALVPPTAELKRVGPIFDVGTYLRMGRDSLAELRKFAYLKPEHSVLDVGCGYGRVAIHLSQFLSPGSRYLGIDVVAKEIDWCIAHVTARYPNFLFRHLNVRNSVYNPSGSEAARDTRFPVPEGMQFDCAILFSVFTHMMPEDVAAYLKEISKYLRDGGVLFASFFLINPDSIRHMRAGRSNFRFVEQPGGYFAHNLELHEGAIAFSEDVIWSMLSNAGFSRDKIVYGNWSGRRPAEGGQDLVICTKQVSLGRADC
jgi:SAM-dependent methyltransferase